MNLPYRTTKNAAAVSKIFGKSLDTPEWWRVEASTDEAEELLVYDYIGWPFNDPYDLAMHLKALKGKDVTVKINSPGGDVFDGLAIYGALQEHDGKVTTINEGLAASMASVLAVAGAEVKAKKYSMMLIHDPWTVMVGNQYELREVAGLLEKLSGNILDIYSAKIGGKKRDIKQKMKDETWFTASEAKEYGLVDTILDTPAAKAAFDLSMFSNVPDELLKNHAGRELNEREIERALREAGASRGFAKAVVAKNLRPLREAEVHDELQTLINTIKGDR